MADGGGGGGSFLRNVTILLGAVLLAIGSTRTINHPAVAMLGCNSVWSCAKLLMQSPNVRTGMLYTHTAQPRRF